MPYKDPEKRKAYHEAYMKKYQAEWRSRHPDYNKNYLREWRKENPGETRTLEQNNERQKRYYQNNAEKVKARKMLRQAVAKGLVSKPTRCENCRHPLPLQADHHDYSRPFDVTWLCRPCHMEITVRRKRLGVEL